MKGAVLYGPRDFHFVEREDPRILEPTDVILRLAATCVCGSDPWPYRGLQPIKGPSPMGHEYCGIVEETGRDVKSVRKGQFVVGSFIASDDTCPICQAGYQSRCVNAVPMGALGAQAPFLRVPLADGTLVATPESHGVEIPGRELFFAEVHLLGGPAPVRRFLPELIALIWKGAIEPGKVFDLVLPLAEVAEGYAAMDERRAIKTLLMP